MPTKLQTEIVSLRVAIKTATGHPFLPTAARDALEKACAVIEQLAAEVLELRGAVDRARDLVAAP